MNHTVYRYEFAESVAIEDVEAAIVLTVMAVESLRGSSQVRLDVSHFLDRSSRRCVIDATTQVGQEFNRLFVGYLDREIGADEYHVKRMVRSTQTSEQPTT
ncbi:MAG: hypothetical protein R3C10_18840 [Pirellulales bacterium]